MMNKAFVRTAASLAAMGLTGASAMAESSSGAPVDLAVDRNGSVVTLTLKGAATAPVDVIYELDVDGASTVHQKGSARLVPQGAESLVRVTINADRPWRAKLRVTANGHDYTEERSSS